MELVKLRMVFGVCSAAAALAFISTSAKAAQPSPDKLNQMGLSGATIVSDGVAMEVRGMGRVVVWGKAKASNGVVRDRDRYVERDSNFAYGVSYASVPGAAAGGFSAAVAY